MPGRQARCADARTIARALRVAKATKHSLRNQAVLLLSFRAGLRACEIARLDWSMMKDSRGRLARFIDVRDVIAKRGGGRRIPLHPELRTALERLLRDGLGEGAVISSARGGHMRPNSLVNWFRETYRAAGAEGCSSHTGRRTFITNAARAAHHAGATLRDIQLLAGHRSIETTQRYIDGDTGAQRRLVRAL